MKKEIVAISLLTITLTGFSQNKKEQLEALNFSLDSCKTVLGNQTQELNSKKIKISELEQKLLQERQISQERDKQISLLKKENDSLKNLIPAEASFNFKVENQVENQDERIGSDSETKVFLMIQNQLVDTYLEFGNPELNKNKNQIYLNSEMSEKSYEIVSISSTKILVKRHFFCSDCETQESEMEKIYLKDVSGIWKFQSCTGDCEDDNILSNALPSEWVFAQPKYENVTIFFDPIHNQKTGSFLESGEVFSAGEIKNGFMEVEYYYGGMQETGWVRVSDLEQASIPKAEE